MRLWIRIAWRLLEWPVNILGLWLPMCFCIWWGVNHPNAAYKTPSEYPEFGVGLLAFIAAFLGTGQQAVLECPYTRMIARAFRTVVTEERKKMEVERGDPTKDTYLRPVE